MFPNHRGDRAVERSSIHLLRDPSGHLVNSAEIANALLRTVLLVTVRRN
jgi:hypothetical protein